MDEVEVGGEFESEVEVGDVVGVGIEDEDEDEVEVEVEDEDEGGIYAPIPPVDAVDVARSDWSVIPVCATDRFPKPFTGLP